MNEQRGRKERRAKQQQRQQKRGNSKPFSGPRSSGDACRNPSNKAFHQTIPLVQAWWLTGRNLWWKARGPCMFIRSSRHTGPTAYHQTAIFTWFKGNQSVGPELTLFSRFFSYPFSPPSPLPFLLLSLLMVPEKWKVGITSVSFFISSSETFQSARSQKTPSSCCRSQSWVTIFVSCEQVMLSLTSVLSATHLQNHDNRELFLRARFILAFGACLSRLSDTA